MNSLRALTTLVLFAHACTGLILKPMTPIMGFSTWNTFGCDIDEATILDVADAMVNSGLQALGYNFINLDDCWAAYDRNASGHIVADPDRFPSGMESLGGKLHAMGFNFGLYTARSQRTCTDTMPGSLGNEVLDAATFALYGADFVKNDDCSVVYADAEKDYGAMQDAIAGTARPMIHSVKAPDLPASSAPSVAQFRRVGKDLKNSWENVVRVLDTGTDESFSSIAGAGFFNDFDMLEIGATNKDGGDPVLTDAEQRAHFSLWAALKSPLVLGNDPRKMTDTVLATLANAEVIAVNADPLGVQAVPISITAPPLAELSGVTTKVALEPCTSGSNDRQRWLVGSNGTIHLASNPDLCFGVYQCESRWPYWTVVSPCSLDNAAPSPSLGVPGGAAAAACSTAAQQTWATAPGSVSVQWTPSPESASSSCWPSQGPGYGCCLSAEGANPEVSVCGWPVDSTMQQWAWQDEGGNGAAASSVVSAHSGQCLTVAGDLQVFAGPLEGGRASVVLLNRAATAHMLTVAFGDVAARFGDRFPLGAGQQVKVRDLWAHEDKGAFLGSYSTEVGSHEVVHLLLEVVPGVPALPHIVFVLLDDFGWNDLGAHNGGEVHSPAMDGLLADGIELTNYYVECVCSPSRATIMTGRYPLHHGVVDWLQPADARSLPAKELTVADRLAAAGWKCHAMGKWHLGFYNDASTPTFRGFESFVGFYGCEAPEVHHDI